MTKHHFNEITARAQANADGEKFPEDPDIVIICVKDGQPAHPLDFGFKASKRFQERCQAMVDAVKDRRDLLQFIKDGFEIEWHEDDCPQVEMPQGLTHLSEE